MKAEKTAHHDRAMKTALEAGMAAAQALHKEAVQDLAGVTGFFSITIAPDGHASVTFFDESAPDRPLYNATLSRSGGTPRYSKIIEDANGAREQGL